MFPTLSAVTESAVNDGAAAPSAAAAADGAAAAADGDADADASDGDAEARPAGRAFEPGADGVMVIPSLCMGCREEGTTRLLLTHIPFFRDVILMAFECDACGLRNSEVQSAEVQSRGARFEVRVATAADLNRQLVKGDKATATVRELGLEIPPATQAGVFTTIEGLLSTAAAALAESQPLRRAISPADADAVEAFVARLVAAHTGAALPFTFELDDPSGNSFVENPFVPKADPRMRVRHYARTAAQNEALCLAADNARGGSEAGAPLAPLAEEGEDAGAAAAGGAPGGAAPGADEDVSSGGAAFAGSAAVAVHRNRAVDVAGALAAAAERVRAGPRAVPRDVSGNTPSGFRKGGAQILNPTARAVATAVERARAGVTRDAAGGIASLMFDSSTSESAAEAIRFAVDCHNCGEPGECLMCCTDVPHFKEVILMGFSCDGCGWKNVEVKGGGAVPPAGTITELRFTPGMPWSADDLGRDVIKGDTASVEIPELDLELDQGSLGGLYSTVEGLLAMIKDKLVEVDPLGAAGGDSVDVSRRAAFAAFLAQLDACREGTRAFTLRLVDPMANTWIHSPFHGAKEADPRLSHATYLRTPEEDLDLGLLDMCAPTGDEAEAEEAGAAAS